MILQAVAIPPAVIRVSAGENPPASAGAGVAGLREAGPGARAGPRQLLAPLHRRVGAPALDSLTQEAAVGPPKA
jgi:hypothetical protein